MEFIIELILEFFGELILQLFGEFLMEIGLRSLAEVFENRTVQNPLLAVLGYAIMGTILGGLSLLAFPRHFIQNQQLRLLATILTPVVSGLCMSALGAWRRKKGQRLIRLDSFAYGFVFALAMAIIRAIFTAK
jgi:hypothetical protein